MVTGERDPAAVKALVRTHWRRRAATFDEEPQHGIHSERQRERWLSVLGEWTGDPPRRALDVGCGTGVVSLLLAALGHDVTGIDAAPEMVARARQKARRAGHSVAFALGDATALGLKADAFDLLVSRHLLWTLPEPARALAEWRRVVDPGGRIVLIEGKWNHDEPRAEYGEIHGDLPLYDGRSPEDVRELLTAAGLVDVEHEPLMDDALWGREPRHRYYLVTGTVPG